MDADATSALHKRGVAVTNDTSKFVWFQVSIFFFFLCWIGPYEKLDLFLAMLKPRE